MSQPLDPTKTPAPGYHDLAVTFWNHVLLRHNGCRDKPHSTWLAILAAMNRARGSICSETGSNRIY